MVIFSFLAFHRDGVLEDSSIRQLELNSRTKLCGLGLSLGVGVDPAVPKLIHCLSTLPTFTTVALWNRADHYIFILWFLLSLFFFFLFSSPNLSGRRLDVCHTYGVALVQI